MSSARTKRAPRRSQSPDAPAGEQPGLRTLMQRRFLNDVFQLASEKWPGWKILVVDNHSMRVISSAVGMYDIMERKVTLVESLDKKRAPFPDMGAIYLLEPSSDSVAKLIADYSGEKILYGDAVFLYFLGRLPDELFERMKTCKPLLKRLKALTEINVDFLPKEERAFTLDMRESFSSFYLRRDATPAELKIAQKLVTVCATLNEYPHIRYRQSSAVCTSLANVFHLKMDEFVAQNPKWWYHGGPQKSQTATRERGVLLLLDRADDCLTPLMHDFTYQSMVNDLLTMDEDRITFQSETASDPDQTQSKDVLLDEKDKLWVELRGKHIAEVISTLSERIREITSSATGSALGKQSGQGNMSLSQMAAALKALPEYKEVMSKLSQHMHISHECMDVFRNENLLDLSEVEQTLATGKDDEGRSPKMSEIMDQVEQALSRMKNSKDRLRMILIATISQGGLNNNDRRRLMNAAELSRQEMQTLNNLEVLGLSIFATEEKKNLVSMLTGRGGSLKAAASSDDEGEYAASRYVPPLRTILEELCSNELSFEEYPSVLPMPDQASPPRGGRGGTRANKSGAAASARKSTMIGPSNRWAKSSGGDAQRSAGPTNFNGGRFIVFTMGGMAFSELRVCRDLMAKELREIVAGSTAFISPNDFLDDLSTLARND